MRILGAGDNVVDRYLELETMFPGGNALNVAVAARRAGAEAAYLGVLGDDLAGDVVRRALEAEGVETARVRIAHGPNAYAEVQLVNGNRVFVGGNETISRFSLTEEDLAYAATFDLIHTDDCGFLEAQVSDLAGLGRPVSFDFSFHREPEYVAPLLPYLAVACFSASHLDDDATLAFLRDAVSRGPRWALATRGALDVLLTDGSRTWRQPVIQRSVVDTLGAGDSFIGRFLVGVIAEEDPAVALRAAAEAASETCGQYGAFGHGCPFVPVEEGAPLGADVPR